MLRMHATIANPLPPPLLLVVISLHCPYLHKTVDFD